jgi:hypothetical protein
MLRFIGWYWSIPWVLIGPYIIWSLFSEGETVPAVVAGVLFLAALLLLRHLGRTRAARRREAGAGYSVTRPGEPAALGSTPPARRTPNTDPVKEAETVVHAYSHLVSESGTRLPESALPYPKDAIRHSLLLWGALDSDPEVRDRLCSIYALLEDFLPHDDWLVLNEWDRIVKTKDVDALMKADKEFGERAVALMKETTARRAKRMDEFKLKLHQLDEARRPAS